jgi:hypothetical protein
MKTIIASTMLCLKLLITSLSVNAQHSLTIAAGTNFKIEAGTSVYVDGLVLKPSGTYDIPGSNSFTKSAVAISLPPVNHIDRMYHLLAALPPFTGDLTIYYEDSELNGVPEGALGLKLYNGSAWSHYNGTTRNTVNNFVATAGLSNVVFSTATLGSSGVALPVTLSRFWPEVDNCKALLQWTTAMEQNSRHFEVQHSVDGLQFTSVGIVAASRTSSTERQYSFGLKLTNTNNYFRLLMVDRDGSSTLSQIITIRRNCTSGSITVYPNPARSNITITGLTGVNQVQFIDAVGRPVRIVRTTGSTENLDISELSAGSYVLRIIKDGAIIENIKVIKTSRVR